MGSNLEKLFCTIMNNRIVTFLKRRSILHKSQIGFLPKQRTSDHIYSLHTLINKNLKGKQRKIFTCFVDLKKAFDSVWHDGLLYKLLQIGIGGKTFDVIQSMYRNSRCAVKIGNCRTAFFQQGRGVRQGCSLSPTLFNIYINDEEEEELLPSGHQAPKHKLCFINTHKTHCQLLYVQYHEQPVCTSLLFTSLFIKSQYTVFCFLFLYILLFFLHILLFFCTSHCLLHISLSFAHLIVFCTSYCFALFYFIAHFILISPFLTICMPLCYVTYIICILIVLHCPLSGPDSIAFHF